MLERLKKDCGFAGTTHSLTAVAIYLLVTAFFPLFVFDKVLETRSVFIYVCSVIIVAGAALLPDLDNTKSTVISSLGIIGQILSGVMREFAVVFYSLFHSKYDNKEPDPHRSFWHTMVSVILVGFIVLTLTSIPFNIELKTIEKTVTLGDIFALMFVFICLQLAFAGLLSKLNQKIRRKGFLIKTAYTLISALLSISILVFAPAGLSYRWLAGVIALGYLFHILGDTMTVAGTPLLFPIPTKGKYWWTHRLLKIKSGGSTEKLVIVPISIILSIYAIVRIVIFLKP